MNAAADPTTTDPRISVVVLTYNRVDELDRTLRHLTALPERPHLIVVDNASRDGTAEHVRSAFPAVELVRCAVNRGAAARNDGVARVRTPYVAFCDDDTWWDPGALRRAADVLDAHPRVALISGCVLVGPENRLDPACERMADSPLDSSGLPGPALVAYMAGAAVMRADAFREVGGYEERFFLGAEEALVAMDLLARRWHMVYRADVVTHHHPSPARAQTERQVMHVRKVKHYVENIQEAGDRAAHTRRRRSHRRRGIGRPRCATADRRATQGDGAYALVEGQTEVGEQETARVDTV